MLYNQSNNKMDIAFYKTFAVFIPSCITNNRTLETLVKNIQLLNTNMIPYKGRFDIFIINNSVTHYDLIVN